MTDITIINVNTKEVVTREYNQEDLQRIQAIEEQIQQKIQEGTLQL